jgi:hypothetical protein
MVLITQRLSPSLPLQSGNRNEKKPGKQLFTVFRAYVRKVIETSPKPLLGVMRFKVNREIEFFCVEESCKIKVFCNSKKFIVN